jgi:signal transduction histidine kinase
MIDSLKDYLKQQHEDSSVYLQLLDRLNDARRIAHNLRKRLLLYRHTAGLTNSMNTLLDLMYELNLKNKTKTNICFLLFRLECKPISADLHPTEDNSTLSFIQYDL